MLAEASGVDPPQDAKAYAPQVMVVAAQLFMLTHRLQTLGNAGVSAAGVWRSDGLVVAPLRTDSPAQRGSLQAAATVLG